MTLREIFRTTGSAMLAVLLASTALAAPAHAEQDNRRGGGRSAHAHSGGGQPQTKPQSSGRSGWQGMNGRQGAGGNWRGGGSPRMERRSDAGSSARAQGSYRGGDRGAYSMRGSRADNGAGIDRGSSSGERRGWNLNRNNSDSPRAGNSVSQPRSYADPSRNRSYTDPSRSARRDDRRGWDNDRNRASNRDRDSWRNNDRRWDRDRSRWSSNDRRWDRDRDHWRSSDRRWDRDHRHSRWDNNWRRDRRYDWYSYRNSYRHIYRPGPYYAPYHGYNYSRLSIGFFLGSGFYGSSYWISDPGYYRLPPAYGSYRWVRYYDDVLLVDIYSGEVIDVIYDFFW